MVSVSGESHRSHFTHFSRLYLRLAESPLVLHGAVDFGGDVCHTLGALAAGAGHVSARLH